MLRPTSQKIDMSMVPKDFRPSKPIQPTMTFDRETLRKKLSGGSSKDFNDMIRGESEIEARTSIVSK